MKPKRIQLKRSKGYHKPEGAVVVSRPSKWGNPFYVTDNAGLQVQDQYAVDCREHAVSMYRRYLLEGKLHVTIEDVRRELHGKDLACWCKCSPCHADVLLEIGNQPETP